MRISKDEYNMLGNGSRVYWRNGYGEKDKGIVYDTCFENNEVELVISYEGKRTRAWIDINDLIKVVS